MQAANMSVSVIGKRRVRDRGRWTRSQSDAKVSKATRCPLPTRRVYLLGRHDALKCCAWMDRGHAIGVVRILKRDVSAVSRMEKRRACRRRLPRSGDSPRARTSSTRRLGKICSECSACAGGTQCDRKSDDRSRPAVPRPCKAGFVISLQCRCAVPLVSW